MKKPEILLDLTDLNKEDIKLGRVIKRLLNEPQEAHAKALEGPGPSPKGFEPKAEPKSKEFEKAEPKSKEYEKAEPKKDSEKAEPKSEPSK